MRINQLLTGMAIAIGLCFTFSIGTSAQVKKQEVKKVKTDPDLNKKNVEKKIPQEKTLPKIPMKLSRQPKKPVTGTSTATSENPPSNSNSGNAASTESEVRKFLNRWYNGNTGVQPYGTYYDVSALPRPTSVQRLPTKDDVLFMQQYCKFYFQKDLSKNPNNAPGWWMAETMEDAMNATPEHYSWYPAVFFPACGEYHYDVSTGGGWVDSEGLVGVYMTGNSWVTNPSQDTNHVTRYCYRFSTSSSGIMLIQVPQGKKAVVRYIQK